MQRPSNGSCLVTAIRVTVFVCFQSVFTAMFTVCPRFSTLEATCVGQDSKHAAGAAGRLTEKESSKRAQWHSIRVFGRLYVERPRAFCAAPGAPLGRAKAELLATPREPCENRENRESCCENRL